ncbi:MAG: XdhC family protein [Elusimicrobia bacterium]|nr:XdhC family protein [Elusimicrobiota bacterium]MDE2425141.1 XdhC family protein [Elusimicrobiota bacterium]
MNGVSVVELTELLRALEGEGVSSRTPPVLATVASLDGSVYARAGAMALLVSGASSRSGVLDLEELDELREQALAVGQDGRPRLVRLSLSQESVLVGWGLGLAGEVEVFLERTGPGLRDCLAEARSALLGGRGVVLSLDLTGPNVGRRRVLSPDNPAATGCFSEMTPELDESMIRGAMRRVLRCPIQAMGKALIFGSSRDAASLARHLHELGFSVFVGDPRRGRLRGADWSPAWGALIEGGWGQVRAAANPDEETSIVVMTHSFALDLETLQGALASPAPYVGLPGPRERTGRLLGQLQLLGAAPRPGQLYAPAGLDLGAQTSRETALSVAAEILAVRSGRRGGRASRVGQAHSSRAAKVAGLIFSAGRRPVLRQAVVNALESRLEPIVVVLGGEAGRDLEGLRGLEDARLRIVVEPRWRGGIRFALEAGLREVPWGAPGAVLLAGHAPAGSSSIERVLSEFERSGRPVLAARTVGGAAQLSALPRSLFPELRAASGEDAVDEIASRHRDGAIRISLSESSRTGLADDQEPRAASLF